MKTKIKLPGINPINSNEKGTRLAQPQLCNSYDVNFENIATVQDVDDAIRTLKLLRDNPSSPEVSELAKVASEGLTININI